MTASDRHPVIPADVWPQVAAAWNAAVDDWNDACKERPVTPEMRQAQAELHEAWRADHATDGGLR